MEHILKKDRVQFVGIISLVLALIIIKSANGYTLFSSVAHQYIEETSASVNPPETQASDINSLMATGVVASDPVNLDLNTTQENTLLPSDPASTDYIDSFKPNEVVQYTVKPGDSIGSIANDFGVSVNTIIWANSLHDPNSLSSGQVLKIPPVTGVIHTVVSGDTLASVAQKYKADVGKIVSFNNLANGEPLVAGDQLMVPGGELPQPKPVAIPRIANSSIYRPVGDGQCVAFVQAHGFAGLHGNAYQWARYINTDAPAAGEVVVLKNGRLGHVALITAVKPDSIQIVEQNYYGLFVIDHREISLDNKAIVGFIQ